MLPSQVGNCRSRSRGLQLQYRVRLDGAVIRSLPIPLPPLPEQRRIAEVLDSIDEAIERAETVISSMERLRDALLHELLTKGVPGWHTEWKDAPNIGQIPACWEVARLGDVCETLGDNTNDFLDVDYAWGLRLRGLKILAMAAFHGLVQLRIIEEEGVTLTLNSSRKQN